MSEPTTVGRTVLAAVIAAVVFEGGVTLRWVAAALAIAAGATAVAVFFYNQFWSGRDAAFDEAKIDQTKKEPPSAPLVTWGERAFSRKMRHPFKGKI